MLAGGRVLMRGDGYRSINANMKVKLLDTEHAVTLLSFITEVRASNASTYASFTPTHTIITITSTFNTCSSTCRIPEVSKMISPVRYFKSHCKGGIYGHKMMQNA